MRARNSVVLRDTEMDSDELHLHTEIDPETGEELRTSSASLRTEYAAAVQAQLVCLAGGARQHLGLLEFAPCLGSVVAKEIDSLAQLRQRIEQCLARLANAQAHQLGAVLEHASDVAALDLDGVVGGELFAFGRRVYTDGAPATLWRA